MKPAEMTTPVLLAKAALAIRDTGDIELADELDMRGTRIDEMQYQCGTGHHDLDGQTPAQIMATVNAPSPG